MLPLLKHLHGIFPELSIPTQEQTLAWNFKDKIKELGPGFYEKVVPLHSILTLEYSILRNQLRQQFQFPELACPQQVTKQLAAALMMSELLEHTFRYYLIVPREVTRLRKQQQQYKKLLAEVGYQFSSIDASDDSLETEFSLTQQVRDAAVLVNWYRLFVTRSKRVLNVLELAGIGSESFSRFVLLMDKYTNPFFAYLGWCFFVPRLGTNLFLLFKHLIPGFWMDENEKALGWYVRLVAQLQRRGFELGNDLVWAAVGLIQCFVLTGALAPLGIYLSLAAFAFDVVNASVRAYIELDRLFQLQKDYASMMAQASDDEKKEILEYQQFIKSRIEFEQLRLGLSVLSTSCIFFAMSLALPMFAVSPILPLISAILLVLIGVASYALTLHLDKIRPKDTIENPVSVAELGIFAKNNKVKPRPTSDEDLKSVEVMPASISCS